MEDYIFSVSEYIDLINETLKVRKITVQGEITSFNIRGGAVFFTIADSEEEAILECVIWKSVFENLGIELEEGLEVKISGTASVYKKSGRFRFVAYNIIPIGEGALRKAFENLKQKLFEQGYFDVERKREIPKYIENIGLITANGSDAKKDFETHVGKFNYKIYFHDVKVEGTNAIKEITKAFEAFNTYPKEIDVLVLTRGGGSLESLLAFNSEEVAKAIFKSKIPVICAVGHENDVTIADLVADLRTSTPTDAGKYISQPYKDIKSLLLNSAQIMENEIRREIRLMENETDSYKERMTKLFEQCITRTQQKISMLQQNQLMSLKNVLDVFKHMEIRLLNSVNQYSNEINNTKDHLTYYQKILNANDPVHKLKQGYSITKDQNGKIIKSVDQLKKGSNILTSYADGNSSSEIKEVNKDE